MTIIKADGLIITDGINLELRVSDFCSNNNVELKQFASKLGLSSSLFESKLKGSDSFSKKEFFRLLYELGITTISINDIDGY